jgi:hypothetical protein
MLKDEEIARSLKEQIQPQDFTDPLFQRAVQRIFAALEKTGRLDMGTLIQDEDEELKSDLPLFRARDGLPRSSQTLSGLCGHNQAAEPCQEDEGIDYGNQERRGPRKQR